MKKKLLLLLMIGTMSLSLTACNEVKNLQKQIEEIGEVTLEDADAIQAAETAYEGLSDDEKEKVENYDALAEARKTYDALEIEEQHRQAYEAGKTAFDQKEYQEAMNFFEEAKDYEDASELRKQAEKGMHYENGLSKMEENALADAVSELAAAADFEDTVEKLKECGAKLLEEKKYEDAKNAFSQAGDDDYVTYIEGIEKMNSKDYEGAINKFNSVESVKGAKKMTQKCNLAQAKAKMDEGHLNEAKAILEKLPGDLKYDGNQVDSLLNKINKHSDYLAVCGRWKSDNIKSSITQTHDSTGLWDSWDGDGTGYCLDITCVINDDDTVSMKAVANYWLYKNFSSLSSNLRTGDYSKTFKDTGASLPGSMSTDNATLSVAPGNFGFDFSLTDPNVSINFTYSWTCNGTYTQLVKAY